MLWAKESPRDPVTNKKWRAATFDVGVQVDEIMPEVTVKYKGKELAAVKMMYLQDSNIEAAPS
jgi:hypothetical protein